MSEGIENRFAADRLGRPPRKPIKKGADVLQRIWVAAINGEASA